MSSLEPLKARYGDAFFQEQQDGSLRSALQVLPAVLDLVRPRSVCDFGCGVGPWLAAAKMLGATEVLGIDGPHVDLAKLKIDCSEFLTHDFETPLQLPRTFDLAMSLEVVEHFEDRFSDAFLDSLTRAAPIILFSAAVPGQGGTHHVNERWASYWLRKFEARNYYAFDCIRPAIWHNIDVEWWYAQNTFLLASADSVDRLEKVARTRVSPASPMLNVVHPQRIFRGRPAIDHELSRKN
jgi:SAM-dependent methyltransferase